MNTDTLKAERTRTFFSAFSVGGHLPSAPEAVVKAEPMLFAASFRFAFANGGVLTREFLHALPDSWASDPTFIVDSRTHMLMPGWYPCIPGWHLDDVPRTRANGQPDHITPAYEASHVMALWGNASVTSFAVGDIALTEPDDDPVYGVWHSQIDSAIRAGALRERLAPTEQLIYFNWQTFHKGNPAFASGWRFFIRGSRGTERAHRDEMRTQVQVYLSTVNAGW